MSSVNSDRKSEFDVTDIVRRTAVSCYDARMAAKAIPQRRFGQYRLCARLASGGMGTVYLAKSGTGGAGSEQLVALKRIHEHLAEQAKFVKMFHDEARIATLIDHPNVCGVLDFGEVEGVPFLAMPFLVGETVKELMERLATEPPESVECFMFARIIMDACEGLHAAHELADEQGVPLNVVHRDVTPHNLFVGYDGRVSVLDFGVAAARHKLASTVTGEVKGKFAYMAPEHLDGVGTDRRADIWSLGVVLWESLARDRLFAGDNMADTVQSVLSGSVPSLSDYRFDVPLGLEEIVFRALARDRNARYPTARAMADDIRAFLQEEEVAVGELDVSRYMHRLFPTGEVSQHSLVGDSTGVTDLVASGHVALADGFDDAPTMAITASEVRPRLAARRAPLPAVFLAGAATVGLLGGLVALALQGDHPLQEKALRAAAAPPQIDPVALNPPERTDPDEGVGEPLTFELDDVELVGDPEASDPDLSEEDPLLEGSEPADADPEVDERPPAMMRAIRRPRRGTVNVATPGGWAIVFAGGRRIGEAPGTFTLPVGTRNIEIQPFGRGAKIRRSVRVRSGGRTRVSVPVRN